MLATRLRCPKIFSHHGLRIEAFPEALVAEGSVWCCRLLQGIMHGVGRRWFVSSRQHACAAPCSSQVDDKVLEAGKLESDATASDAREMQVSVPPCCSLGG